MLSLSYYYAVCLRVNHSTFVNLSARRLPSFDVTINKSMLLRRLVANVRVGSSAALACTVSISISLLSIALSDLISRWFTNSFRVKRRLTGFNVANASPPTRRSYMYLSRSFTSRDALAVLVRGTRHLAYDLVCSRCIYLLQAFISTRVVH